VLDDSEGQWVLEGGTDLTTGLPIVGVDIAPASWSVITPLSTMVSMIAAQNAMTVAQAASQILLATGLPSQLDLSSYDPMAGTSAGDTNGPVVESVRYRSRAGEQRGCGLVTEVGFHGRCQVGKDRAAL
jgi:hypothetical protein